MALTDEQSVESKEPAPLANPDLMVSRALWQAQHAVEQAADAALAPLGVTTTLAGILAFLAQSPGTSAAAIARRARVAPQSVAKALVRLEQLGLVERSSHPTHGRVKQLVLTDAGIRLHVDASRILADMDEQIRAGIGGETHERLTRDLELLRSLVDQSRQARRSAR